MSDKKRDLAIYLSPEEAEVLKNAILWLRDESNIPVHEEVLGSIDGKLDAARLAAELEGAAGNSPGVRFSAIEGSEGTAGVLCLSRGMNIAEARIAAAALNAREARLEAVVAERDRLKAAALAAMSWWEEHKADEVETYQGNLERAHQAEPAFVGLARAAIAASALERLREGQKMANDRSSEAEEVPPCYVLAERMLNAIGWDGGNFRLRDRVVEAIAPEVERIRKRQENEKR